MKFINNINEDSILLVPDNIKDKILEYINNKNLLINIKIIDFKDLKIKLFYDYNIETIKYVMDKYNLKYDMAHSYIEDTYYVNEEKYTNNKMNYLLKIKNDLINNNLLIKDDLFIKLLQSKKKLYVYGYDYINKYQKYLLNICSSYIEIEYVEKEKNNYKHQAYEFDDIESEVMYVAESISELLSNNIDINNIFIANYQPEYYFTINRIFKEYNIPYNINNNDSIYSTTLGQYFINNICNNKEESLNKLNDKCHNENDNKIYAKILDLVNKIYWQEDLVAVKDLICEELKNIKTDNITYDNAIRNIDITNNIIDDDQYIFLIGFNNEYIPKIKKDEDYINDAIKPEFIENTNEYNKNNKLLYLNSIKNIKNLTITYKLNTNFSNCYPSSLIDNDFIKKEHKKTEYSKYSNDYNKLLLAQKIDNLIKFNEYDTTLEKLNSSYDIPYITYSNKYSGINNFDEDITLSYSNLSTYFNCPFHFYLSSILKLDTYEQTFYTHIGSLFHSILESCLNTDKNIDVEYDKYISKYTFTNKELFFLEKLRPEIHSIIKNIKEQYNYSSHNPKEEWHEKRLSFTTKELGIKSDKEIIIKGFVDKCLVIGNDIVIIDYKTGSTDKIDPELFKYGLSLQLPLYMYLLKHENSNYNIVGMYLQHILSGNFIKELGKEIEEDKFKKLKLDGITIKDETKIKEFDKSYEQSEIIKSLKIVKKTNELPDNNRFITYEQQDELVKFIGKLLEETINNIEHAKFDIEPIYIEKKANGCDYCPFKDICYRKNNDYRIEEGE